MATRAGDASKAAWESQLAELGTQTDAAYRQFFTADLELSDGTQRSFEGLSEAEFQLLGKTEPEVRATSLQCAGSLY